MYEQLKPARALMGREAIMPAPAAATSVRNVPRRVVRVVNARMAASNRCPSMAAPPHEFVGFCFPIHTNGHPAG